VSRAPIAFSCISGKSRRLASCHSSSSTTLETKASILSLSSATISIGAAKSGRFTYRELQAREVSARSASSQFKHATPQYFLPTELSVDVFGLNAGTTECEIIPTFHGLARLSLSLAAQCCRTLLPPE